MSDLAELFYFVKLKLEKEDKRDILALLLGIGGGGNYDRSLAEIY